MGLQGVTKEVVSSLLDTRRRLRRVALINFIKKYFAGIYLIIFIVKQNNKFKKKHLNFLKKIMKITKLVIRSNISFIETLYVG